MVVQIPTHALGAIIALGNNGTPSSYEAALYENSGSLYGIRSHAQPNQAIVGSFTSTAMMDILLEVDPGGTAARIYINGTLAAKRAMIIDGLVTGLGTGAIFAAFWPK